jgi:protein-disulfide isomerase
VAVSSTPTLFVNGRQIGNFDAHLLDVYKSLVEFAAKPGGN